MVTIGECGLRPAKALPMPGVPPPMREWSQTWDAGRFGGCMRGNVLWLVVLAGIELILGVLLIVMVSRTGLSRGDNQFEDGPGDFLGILLAASIVIAAGVIIVHTVIEAFQAGAGVAQSQVTNMDIEDGLVCIRNAYPPTGVAAQPSSTTGSYWTAIGQYAGYSNGGRQFTAVGRAAGFDTGSETFTPTSQTASRRGAEGMRNLHTAVMNDASLRANHLARLRSRQP